MKVVWTIVKKTFFYFFFLKRLHSFEYHSSFNL